MLFTGQLLAGSSAAAQIVVRVGARPAPRPVYCAPRRAYAPRPVYYAPRHGYRGRRW